MALAPSSASIASMPWDEEDLNRQWVQKMVAATTLGDGVLVLDDTGFPKQGKASVGVARQYAGTLGQVGHGQIAVTCCDSDPQVTWPVAVRLYLPKTWAAWLRDHTPKNAALPFPARSYP